MNSRFRPSPIRKDIQPDNERIILLSLAAGLAAIIITLIILIIGYWDYKGIVIGFFMAMVIVTLLLGLVIGALIVAYGKKKRKIKIPDFEDSYLPRITEDDRERFIGDNKEPNLLRPKIVFTRSGITVGFKESALIYTGSLINKCCVICKLDLRKRQEVWKCPYCVALFHKEHFKDWISNNSYCPVCQGRITISDD